MASSRGRSKKQSAGSRARPQSLPEDFVLYLDENLHNCKPILDALIQHGVKHERHGSISLPEQRTSRGCPFVGQNGWLLITKDKRIRYNELEKAAVLRHRVRHSVHQGIPAGGKWQRCWPQPCLRWSRFIANMLLPSSPASVNPGV